MLSLHFEALRRLSSPAEPGAEQERASAMDTKLLAMALEAAQHDGSAIIRWSDERQLYEVDPCTEERIVCKRA